MNFSNSNNIFSFPHQRCACTAALSTAPAFFMMPSIYLHHDALVQYPISALEKLHSLIPSASYRRKTSNSTRPEFSMFWYRHSWYVLCWTSANKGQVLHWHIRGRAIDLVHWMGRMKLTVLPKVFSNGVHSTYENCWGQLQVYVSNGHCHLGIPGRIW